MGQNRVGAVRNVAVSVLNSFRRGFKSLRAQPRELWMALVIKMLEAYAFGATSFVLVRFLSGDLGLSDTEAAWAYGLSITLLGIYTMFVGVLVDKLGVKKSLVLGTTFLLFSRVMLTFAPSNAFVFLALFGLLPIGQALGLPVLVTGLKRYTNKKSRSYAFSLFHAMLNVGAFMAAPFSDYAKGLWKEEGLTINFWSLGSVQLPVYRAIFFTTIIATAMMFVIALFVREIKVTEEGEVVKVFPNRMTQTSSDPLLPKKWWILLANWFRPFAETARAGRFWQLLLFLILLVGVRALTSVLNGFFPSYFERELGDGARPGTISAINSGMVIFLAPALAFVAVRVGTFRAILIGATMSAVAVFFLTFGAAMSTAVAFVVMYSIGEAIWYPRLNEYVSTTAPEGREGSFMSLIALPMFFVKMSMSGLYGYLLATYCPKEGPRDSGMMWFWVGLMALASPLLAYVFRNVIDKKGSNLPPA